MRDRSKPIYNAQEHVKSFVSCKTIVRIVWKERATGRPIKLDTVAYYVSHDDITIHLAHSCRASSKRTGYFGFVTIPFFDIIYMHSCIEGDLC